METKFQTSFIPKKPLTLAGSGLGGISVPQQPKRRGTSVFMSIAVIIFIISLGAVAGVHFWKSVLISAQDSYKVQLAQREKQFNLALIEELKRQDVKISLADQLLRNHLAISNIFGIIGSFTIENVRYLSLDLSAPANSTEDVKISMKGQGSNLSAIAFQSKVLATLEEYGLRTIVRNPILSDPVLDASGAVSFGFTATINSGALSYEKSVTSSESAP